MTELEFDEFGYFQTRDREGNMRLAIKFFFKRKGVKLYSQNEKFVSTALAAEPLLTYGQMKPNKTERRGLVTTRVGQSAYRLSVLHRWEKACAVTKFSNPDILIASHIVPWRDADDHERLDVDNGILLSPDYDALFDRNLISFDEKGMIMLGKEIKSNPIELLGLTGKEQVLNFSDQNQHYLEQHRMQLR